MHSRIRLRVRVAAGITSLLMLSMPLMQAEQPSTPTDLDPIPTEQPIILPDARTHMSDGTVVYGSLEEMVRLAGKGKIIYISTESRLYIEEFDLTLLQKESMNLSFLPDPDVFIGKDRWAVLISLTNDLATPLTQERIDAAKKNDKPVQLWFKVIQVPEPTPAVTEIPTAEPQETISPTDVPATPEPEAAATPEAEITETPVPEATETPVPMPTETAEPDATGTPVPEMTETPVPMPTETVEPEATDTPAPVITEEPTPEPSPVPNPPVVTHRPVHPDPTRIPLPTEEAPDDFAVTTEQVHPGEWSNKIPTFHLSGGAEGTSYAALYNDEVLEALESDSFSPETTGVYMLRFALMDDATGGMIEVSTRWSLMLDFDEPLLYVYPSFTENNTLIITTEDTHSGNKEYSVDKGKTWFSTPEDNTDIVLSFPEPTVIPAKTIRIKDNAGNVAIWDEAVTVGPNSSGGWYYGRRFKHIAESEEIAGTYAAFDLTLPTEQVSQLTLGNELADLTVKMTADQRALQMKESVSELKLDNGSTAAALHLAAGQKQSCTWQINGAVLSKLKSSGLDWLILENSGHALVLPTEQTLTGVTYDMMKGRGIGSRSFIFEVVLSAEDCTVTVTADGSSHQALPADDPGFYANLAYYIPVSLLNSPMTEWPGAAAET